MALTPSSLRKRWDLDRGHGTLGSDGEYGCLRLELTSGAFIWANEDTREDKRRTRHLETHLERVVGGREGNY